MRKRIVIAACAVVAIGAFVFVLSQPKKGSVEWHKTRVRQLRVFAYEESFRHRVARWSRRLTGKEFFGVTNDEMVKAFNELDQSGTRLEELGFLIRREYMDTNVPSFKDPAVKKREEMEWRKSIPREHQMFCWMEEGPWYRKSFWVIAPREYQAKWEERVRALDVPATAK